MHDISFNVWQSLSDEAIENKMGNFVKRTRQQKNKTQEEIAKAANISRSTLSLLERGESVNFKTLIQVMRVLDQMHLFQIFSFKDQISPLALAKLQHQPRERVRKSKRNKVQDKPNKSDW